MVIWGYFVWYCLWIFIILFLYLFVWNLSEMIGSWLLEMVLFFDSMMCILVLVLLVWRRLFVWLISRLWVLGRWWVLLMRLFGVCRCCLLMCLMVCLWSWCRFLNLNLVKNGIVLFLMLLLKLLIVYWCVCCWICCCMLLVWWIIGVWWLSWLYCIFLNVFVNYLDDEYVLGCCCW